MNFDFAPEQLDVQRLIREVAAREWAPQAEQWELDGQIPRSVIDQAAEMGLMGLVVPEEFGGNAYDVISLILTIEEIAKVSASLAISISVHNSVGAWPILAFGTTEQKKNYLPRMAKGMLGAFSLSEPNAGSDAGAIETTALRDGDHYVLNGAKNWVTNGKNAGIFTVYATVDRSQHNKSLTAFIVEKGTAGLVLGKKEDKMGLRASDTLSMTLEDARIPVANRLGEEGQGFKIAMAALDGGRIGVAAQALGVAQAAFEQAVRYSRVRKTFGKTLSEHQPIQWMIADMARRIEAARLLTYRAAWLRQQGRPHVREAAMAKLFASECATMVTHKAVQVHGGYGYVKEYPVERYYRDARVMEIYEGASEIQRMVIARSILREGVGT